jgi:hypothetical protein
MIMATMHAPTISVRHYVTMDHLWTARHAARLCGQLEPQLQLNDPVVEHRSPVMTAVFFGAAFLEALVNEVILDVINPAGGVPADRVAGLPADPQTIAALQRLWRNERHTKGGPLGKYQAALDAVGKERFKFSESRDPFKSAQLLFDLRNHFTHFQPKTRDVHTEHDCEKRLKKPRSVRINSRSGFHGSRIRHSALGWRCGPATLVNSSPGVGGIRWVFAVLTTLRSITACRTSVRVEEWPTSPSSDRLQ